jgi:cytochrome c peroxidase
MKFLVIVLTLIALVLSSCGDSERTEYKQQVLAKAKNIFAVLPDKMPGSENDTPDRIALGKKLYFEDRLSLNDDVSCNFCHDIQGEAGVDNLPLSEGTTGEDGARNSNTVLNSGFQIVQFWDGRAKDLKEQAGGPILNPVEMAMPDTASVEKKIKGIDEYKPLFEKSFGAGDDKITFDNITEAIAAFERTLITHDRFDDFLKGNTRSLSVEEVEGLELFITKTCITCHTGPLLGGNMFQKAGLVKPYKNQEDLGRFDVTKSEADKFMFKVPTLRNVALTAPYMHDGGMETLEETVKLMADIQLNQQLTDVEVKKIVAFMNSLSDKILAINKK